MASEYTPNSVLPLRFFEKPHVDSPNKHKFNKIPGRHKSRWIFLPYLGDSV